MLRDFEKGDMVRYTDRPSTPHNGKIGLIVDVQYHVKPDDFLVFIMWDDASKPQALFQCDCHRRELQVLA